MRRRRNLALAAKAAMFREMGLEVVGLRKRSRIVETTADNFFEGICKSALYQTARNCRISSSGKYGFRRKPDGRCPDSRATVSCSL